MSNFVNLQKCIFSDFQRVFEIGPLFRALNGNTHIHLCEYICLDLEMEIKEHYNELLEKVNDLIIFIFQNLNKSLEKFNNDLKFQNTILRLKFKEALTLLQKNGLDKYIFNDFLSYEDEKNLSKIIKKQFQTDIFILYELPSDQQHFYMMECKDDPQYSLAFKIYLNGRCIGSGGQRNYNQEILKQRAKQRQLDDEFIKQYLKSFQFGAVPSAGCSIYLEKLMFNLLNLQNIRYVSLFPRDSNTQL